MSHLLLIFLTTIGIAAAQVDTGTISGLVRDPSSAGIPGVNVTVRDESTGLATGIVTNPTGLYVSPPLRAGTHVVEARAKGFAAAAKRMEGNRSEKSLPLRVISRTPDASRYDMRRKPSCFIS